MASVQARPAPVPLSLPTSGAGFDVVSPFSPLDQIGFAVRRGSADLPAPKDSTAKDATAASPPPIPTLNLNLFRSSSIYSVDSNFDVNSLASSDYDEPPFYVSEPESTDGDVNEAEAETEAEMVTQDESDTDSLDVLDVLNMRPPSRPPSSPSTPRTARTITGTYPGGTASPTRSGSTTPTELIRSAKRTNSKDNLLVQTLPYAPGTLRSAVSDAPFSLRAVPVVRGGRSLSGSTTLVPPPSRANLNDPIRALSDPLPHGETLPQPQRVPRPSHVETTTVPDTASVHGEQGSDWGDDEAGFEWLDAEDAPVAVNGDGSMRRRNSLLSRNTSKRLSRLRTAITPTLLVSDADPNASANTLTPSSPTPSSPGPSPTSSTGHAQAVSSGSGSARKKTKKRPIVIPRRAAPPPPPGALELAHPQQTRSRSPNVLPRGSESEAAAPLAPGPRRASPPTSDVDDQRLPPVVVITATPPRPAYAESSATTTPTMAPLKDEALGLKLNPQDFSRSASAGFSLYELDSVHGTPIPPNGRYTKVPLHEVDRNAATEAPNGRRTAESHQHPIQPPNGHALGHGSLERRPSQLRPLACPSPISFAGERSAEDFMAQAVERREAGDKAKAAWLYMRAAEMGSAAGQMWYGIALKHGLGVARDERRGFNELVAACDRSLAESPVDLRAMSGSTIATPGQARQVEPDLAIGLIEVASSLIEGVGTRKAPEMGLDYLRLAGTLGDAHAQEQLGYRLSKGAGVKRDMKEAARWYRAALASGANIVGIAWVWKDKYNDA